MRQVLHLQVAWTVAAYLKEGTGCFFHEHLLASVWTVAVALSLLMYRAYLQTLIQWEPKYLY